MMGKIPSDFNGDVYDALERADQRVYFRWDIQKDVLDLHEPIPRKFRDFPLHVEFASTELWNNGMLHPSDQPILHSYFHLIFRYAAREDCSMRSLTGKVRLLHHKHYMWCEVHVVTYFSDGLPVRAFGQIRSIQAEKIWQRRLQERADHDKLTSLLNKDASIREITTLLDGLSPLKDQAALFLIDADGFKEINDNFGHLFGDSVLTDMGSCLRDTLRKTDIKGRIGGDEFIALLPGFKDGNSRKIIETIAGRLVTAMHKQYTSGSTTLPLTISLGIALYPQHGTSYRDLFTHADRALYEAKSQGKNQFCFYRQKFLEEAIEVKNQRDPQAAVDIQQRAFEDNMVDFVLQIFYETNSPDATIDYTLGMFGRQYNASRVLISLHDNNTGQFHETFEWRGPSGQIIEKDVPEEDVNLFHTYVRMHYQATPYGVISLEDDTGTLPAAQAEAAKKVHIKAYAYALITHGSDTIGVLGIESSTLPFPLSNELLHSMNKLSVLLGNILLPQRHSEKTYEYNENLHEILDHLQFAVLIVDKETYRPVYYNRFLGQLVGDSAPDIPCYKVFWKKDAPCEDCPIPHLSRIGQEYHSGCIERLGLQASYQACNLLIHTKDGHDRALIVMNFPQE